tara:strand:- start:20 stop:229 length:210 start_codon:yes stop_codon:yes gene_type:complete
MSFGIGMFLRDTSLKFQQQSLDMARAALGSIKSNKSSQTGAYTGLGREIANPYEVKIDGKAHDIKWLLG